jgi:hypothetical protein
MRMVMTRIQTHNHEHIIGNPIALEALVRFGDGKLKHRSCSDRYKLATNIPVREIMLIHAGPRVLSMQGRSYGCEGRTPLQAGKLDR